MKEICTVTKIKRGYAYIEVKRGDECKFCNACAFNDDGILLFPAIMETECSPGDKVVVEMPKKQISFSALILFGIPLFMLFIGFVIGRLLGGDLFMILFGVLFAVLGVVTVVIIEKVVKSRRDYMAVIESRLSDGALDEPAGNNNI